MPDVDGWTSPKTADLDRGASLCEVCEDAMTDDVWPAATNPSGVDLTIGTHGQDVLRSGA